jgi:hypothetical protein
MELAQQNKIIKSKKAMDAKHESRKKLITPKDAAEIFSFSEGGLANLRCHKLGCRFYKVNRKVLYDYDEFESWAKRCPVLTMDSVAQEKEHFLNGEVA